MTVKAWCEENSVNEKQFYYWQRRVREEILGQMVIANTTQVEVQKTTFVQIPDVPKQKKSFKPDMILNCGNYSLELSNTISPEFLSMVIKVISHAE
jgi:putative transposase